MRALVCKELGPGSGESLSLETDWPTPEVGDHDILINVKAAGLNFPDVLIIQGKYQFQPELPFIPGGEMSGVVEAVGSAVTRYKPGDEVISMGSVGGFCEQAVVNEFSAFPKPAALSFEEAAGIAITYFTSYYALKQRANLQPGETMLVLGAAGGVGTTAVELGKLMGARVIAAASSDEKLEVCKQLGADELINYSDVSLKDAVKELTDGKGVDVVYDPVGGDFSEPALRSMAWNGRFLVIGFAAGPIPKVPLNLALLKGCSIVGVFWGRFTGEEPETNLSNINALWELFEAGKIKPVVTDNFPIEQYQDAFQCMTERRARGKVILTF
ncbi:MAG: NADPH:quinone oxidoreductase family protein [Halieaceae bacterium]